MSLKHVLVLVFIVTLVTPAHAEDCDSDSECSFEWVYECAGGNVVRYKQTYRCDDRDCVKDDELYDDEPYDICDPLDFEECVVGKKSCQSVSVKFMETTSTTIPTTTSSTSTTSTSTTYTTTSSTTSTTVLVTTTTTYEPPTTTTTLEPEKEEISFLNKLITRRPIELKVEYFKKLIDVIIFWD